MEALRGLKKHITRIRAIMILLILLVLVSPTVSYVHRNMPASVQTVKQDPIEGETGFSVERKYCEPLRNITIYDGLVSDTTADWYMENQDRPDLREYYGVLGVIEEEEAVRVHLKGQREVGGYVFDSHTSFVGRLTLPIMNYSDITCSVSVSVLQGAVNVTLHASYSDLYLDSWRDGAGTTSTLDAGESSTIDIHPSIANLHNLTTSWVSQCMVGIGLSTSQESTISIGRVTVTATSYEDLYPASFDMQAPDGESLFSNPYTDMMGGYSRIGWPPDYSYVIYPGFVLTQSGTGNPGVYTPYRVNDTVCLRPGNYSGSAGWLEISDHAYPYVVSDFNITINTYESLLVQVRVPVSQLRISVYPAAAYTGIRIATVTNVVFYEIDYPLAWTDFLYLPPVTYFAVVVQPVDYIRVPENEYHSYYRQSMAVVYITKLENSSVAVSIGFPQYGILGLMLDAGQLIGLVSLVMLLLISISFSLRNQYSKSGGNTHLFMPIALFISVFTPWVNYSFETVSYPPTDVGAAVFVPLLTTLWYGPGALVTPAPNTYLFPNSLALGLLYWAPILIMLYYMTSAKASDGEAERIPSSMLHGLWIIMGPLLVATFYLNLCLLGLCTPSIGLIAVLLTIPLWILDGAVRKNKRHLVSKAYPELE